MYWPLLPQAAEALRAALADDHDDDVRCVAAEALGGVAARVGTLLSPGARGAVLGALWDVLLERDELTSSAAHVMTTLSAYCACLPYSALATFGEGGEAWAARRTPSHHSRLTGMLHMCAHASPSAGTSPLVPSTSLARVDTWLMSTTTHGARGARHG